MIEILRKVKKIIFVFIKALVKFRNAPTKYIGHFIYWINLQIVKFVYKKNKENIPNLGDEYCKIIQISIDDNFLKKINSDIALNKEINCSDNNFKYYLVKNNKNSTNSPKMFYDEKFQYTWGFNRLGYINFLKKNFDEDLRKVYHGSNYRVESITIYKTLHFNEYKENRNTKYHSDNDVPGSIKLLIYLCDVDENNGPFAYYSNIKKENVIVKGKIGNSIIFDNNNLSHSGSATINKDRLALSFSIVPTLRKEIIYAEKKPENMVFTFNCFTKYC